MFKKFIIDYKESLSFSPDSELNNIPSPLNINKQYLLSNLKNFKTLDNYPFLKSKSQNDFFPILNLLNTGDKDFSKGIPWDREYISGYSYGKKYHKTILPFPPFKQNIDTRLPYELHRCQHFPRLALAWRAAGEKKYLDALQEQLNDWTDKNPYKIGIGWFCAMDIAIRAVNWIWTYEILRDTEGQSIFDDKIIKTLFLHGRFILENPETQDAGNHLIGDLIGLIYLGHFFDTDESRSWLDYGYKTLFEQIDYQFADGVHFEQTTAYHCLVTEFIAHAFVLAQKFRYFVPEVYNAEFKRMLEYIAIITMPDGTIPLIGDNDDGRLFKLDSENVYDYRDVLNLGAYYFGDKKFLTERKDIISDMLFNRNLGSKNNSQNDNESQSYLNMETGVLVIKDSRHFFLFRAPLPSKPKKKSHLHNDMQSFIYNYLGRDILIDSGSYVYGRDYKARNIFRSARYHNTITIDGCDMNDFPKPSPLHPRLFSMKRFGSYGKVEQFTSTDDSYTIESILNSWLTPTEEVNFTRLINFDLKNEILSIVDSFKCGKFHQIEWNFHFGENLVSGFGQVFEIENDLAKFSFEIFDPGIKADILQTEYSPAYGIKKKGTSLRVLGDTSITKSFEFKLKLRK